MYSLDHKTMADKDETTKEIRSFLLCQCRSIWIVSNECLVISAVVGCVLATWIITNDCNGRVIVFLLFSAPITAFVFWIVLQACVRLENSAMRDELNDDTIVDRKLAHTLPAVAVFEISFAITSAISIVSASGLLGFFLPNSDEN